MGTDHQGSATTDTGLSLAAGGYRLTGVTAPSQVGEEQELTLTIEGPNGQPVTDFDVSHEKELHLIVVRTDGAGFRHVHPQRDGQGLWSIPWQWSQAGSHRVYAEFVPTATGEGITLSTVVQVGGDFTPQLAEEPARTGRTDGYDVEIEGDLAAGASSTLTVRVTRDGEPVTTLEPYLGAYGHLVALREGDLAYLHVHPHGEEPQPGQASGPEVAFEVSPPTPGRYLLYLDFQVDGEVHTAPFVLDTMTDHNTGSGDEGPTTDAVPIGTDPGDGTGHEEGGDHDHDG
ncbi:heavy-metal-associated domain-containing protein [Ornithinimicrobium sp. F0845]|uniref:heavy-metal-associated domain-containing protein n=1 Tax=Ornithinimicrobium sp. F0845 TaxID=2926412 RepID=UPI00248C53BC|nr:heavy-metal-associated domain-containing protein [Ornithinimicrobium sp. F0845]